MYSTVAAPEQAPHILVNRVMTPGDSVILVRRKHTCYYCCYDDTVCRRCLLNSVEMDKIEIVNENGWGGDNKAYHELFSIMLVGSPWVGKKR
jgi:hypothetical protein